MWGFAPDRPEHRLQRRQRRLDGDDRGELDQTRRKQVMMDADHEYEVG